MVQAAQYACSGLSISGLMELVIILTEINDVLGDCLCIDSHSADEINEMIIGKIEIGQSFIIRLVNTLKNKIQQVKPICSFLWFQTE
jgi:hypothetical protein